MFQKMYLDTMRSVDAVTCPTQRYAETIRREINPNAFCLPNCLDLNEWRPGRHPGRDGFRIGWHGGDSHRIDVMQAAEGLGRFLKDHKDATFVLIGANLNEWLMHVPPDQLEYWDWGSYDAHNWRLQCMALDVGLCPVIDHKFNDAKSPLKWEEFAACGVPSVCSNHPPYSDAVRNGEDGILVANEAQEWEKALTGLYNDSAERLALGERAYKRIERDFNIWDKAVEWDALYRKLLADKRGKTLVTKE
jgi:glycosyltransferase involved in cell wall biosynthesis